MNGHCSKSQVPTKDKSRIRDSAQPLEANSREDVFSAHLVAIIPTLRTFAGSLSRRPELVDDLVQETLISLHRKRATYEPSRPFLPWLAAIARYRWVDQLRKTYRADETELVAELSVASDESGIIARISIDRLLEHLPEKQAYVIRMVKIDGLSISEAALRSGQSEPLVKVNIHRGLKKLAALVERE